MEFCTFIRVDSDVFTKNDRPNDYQTSMKLPWRILPFWCEGADKWRCMSVGVREVRRYPSISLYETWRLEIIQYWDKHCYCHSTTISVLIHLWLSAAKRVLHAAREPDCSWWVRRSNRGTSLSLIYFWLTRSDLTTIDCNRVEQQSFSVLPPSQQQARSTYSSSHTHNKLSAFLLLFLQLKFFIGGRRCAIFEI